jgi:hypothetical protein
MTKYIFIACISLKYLFADSCPDKQNFEVAPSIYIFDECPLNV